MNNAFYKSSLLFRGLFIISIKKYIYSGPPSFNILALYFANLFIIAGKELES